MSLNSRTIYDMSLLPVPSANATFSAGTTLFDTKSYKGAPAGGGNLTSTGDKCVVSFLSGGVNAVAIVYQTFFIASGTLTYPLLDPIIIATNGSDIIQAHKTSASTNVDVYVSNDTVVIAAPVVSFTLDNIADTITDISLFNNYLIIKVQTATELQVWAWQYLSGGVFTKIFSVVAAYTSNINYKFFIFNSRLAFGCTETARVLSSADGINWTNIRYVGLIYERVGVIKLFGKYAYCFPGDGATSGRITVMTADLTTRIGVIQVVTNAANAASTRNCVIYNNALIAQSGTNGLIAIDASTNHCILPSPLTITGCNANGSTVIMGNNCYYINPNTMTIHRIIT